METGQILGLGLLAGAGILFLTQNSNSASSGSSGGSYSGTAPPIDLSGLTGAFDSFNAGSEPSPANSLSQLLQTPQEGNVKKLTGNAAYAADKISQFNYQAGADYLIATPNSEGVLISVNPQAGGTPAQQQKLIENVLFQADPTIQYGMTPIGGGSQVFNSSSSSTQTKKAASSSSNASSVASQPILYSPAPKPAASVSSQVLYSQETKKTSSSGGGAR